jgi:hypothetical protein
MQPQKENNTEPYSMSDFIENVFLQPLRMAKEFNQLFDDVFPIRQQQ